MCVPALVRVCVRISQRIEPLENSIFAHSVRESVPRQGVVRALWRAACRLGGGSFYRLTAFFLILFLALVRG